MQPREKVTNIFWICFSFKGMFGSTGNSFLLKSQLLSTRCFLSFVMRGSSTCQICWLINSHGISWRVELSFLYFVMSRTEDLLISPKHIHSQEWKDNKIACVDPTTRRCLREGLATLGIAWHSHIVIERQILSRTWKGFKCRAGQYLFLLSTISSLNSRACSSKSDPNSFAYVIVFQCLCLQCRHAFLGGTSQAEDRLLPLWGASTGLFTWKESCWAPHQT